MTPLFLINSASEGVSRDGSILERLAAENDVKSVHLTSFPELDRIVEESSQNGTDHVFIEGGDGTIQKVLTAFLTKRDAFEILPAFTIVPHGMTNQIAKNIGLKRPDRKLVQAVIDGKNKSRSKTALVCVSQKGQADQFGFLFSTGGVPMVTTYTKKKLHGRGIGGSLAVIGGIMKGVGGDESIVKKTPIALEIAGETPISINENHLASIITTLPSLIMGLDPFWGSETAPLRVTYAGEQAQKLVRNAVSIWAGRKGKDRSADGLKSWNAESVTYDYAGPVVLDGEFLELCGSNFQVAGTDPVTFCY